MRAGSMLIGSGMWLAMTGLFSIGCSSDDPSGSGGGDKVDVDVEVEHPERLFRRPR